MERACCKLCVGLMIASAAVAADRPWSLPADPQAVVVELKYADAADRRLRTALQLRRNGSFIGDVGESGQVRGRLSASDMNDLLCDMIDSSGALRMTTDGLRERIQTEGRRTGRPAQVRDGDDLIVRLALEDRVHELRCPAPEVLRTRYPDLPELEQVCAIRRRLENIVAVERAGGLSAAERVAALATEELRRQNRTDVRVTARDLQAVRGRPGDLRQLQFVVPDSGAPGPSRGEVHISVMESPGAPLQINITQSAAPL